MRGVADGNGHTAASVGRDAPKDNHHGFTVASCASRAHGTWRSARVRPALLPEWEGRHQPLAVRRCGDHHPEYFPTSGSISAVPARCVV